MSEILIIINGGCVEEVITKKGDPVAYGILDKDVCAVACDWEDCPYANSEHCKHPQEEEDCPKDSEITHLMYINREEDRTPAQQALYNALIYPLLGGQR